MTLHAPKILGMMGIATNDDKILADLIQERLEQILVPKGMVPEQQWDRWTKFYRHCHQEYMDNYSFIVALENPAQFSGDDSHRLNFMVNHDIRSIYLPEIDSTIQLEQFFAGLEKLSPEIAKQWLYYIEIGNESGVSQLLKILKWMKAKERVFFIVLNRQKLKMSKMPTPMYNVAMVQKLMSEICHKNDTPLIISTGLLGSMRSKTEPTVAELCDFWDVLELEVQGIWFREEIGDGLYPIELFQMAEAIIANYITESKAKNNKE